MLGESIRDIVALCYNKEGKLTMVSGDSIVGEKGGYVKIEGKTYEVIDARKGINNLSYKNAKVIDLKEYKASKCAK